MNKRSKRTPLLPIGLPNGPAPTLADAPTTWITLFAPFSGIEFGEADRRQIKTIADDYLTAMIVEATSVPITEAEDLFDDIEGALVRLRKALAPFFSERFEDDARHIAARFVENELARTLEVLGINRPDGAVPFQGLSLQAGQMLSQIHETRRRLDNSPHWGGAREHEFWEWMIRRLMGWAESHGYPVTIGKGQRKTTSPFVRFVWELQILLPEDCRRHMTSDDALAVAIDKVRKEQGPLMPGPDVTLRRRKLGA